MLPPGVHNFGRSAEFSRPDDQRLVEQAACLEVVEEGREAMVGGGHERFLSWLKLSPCVSQKFWWSSCQFTVTSPTPASTSRRARSRH